MSPEELESYLARTISTLKALDDVANHLQEVVDQLRQCGILAQAIEGSVGKPEMPQA